MRVEEHFEEFIKLLNYHKVKYLVVGAYALIYYTHPRNTGDIDFFIDATPDNAEKLLSVLAEFGFESLDLKVDDFIKPDSIIQLGLVPNRIDIITEISGITFNEAFQNKIQGKIGKQEVFFISPEDLLKNKKAANRARDIADAELLENYLKHKKNHKTI
ncbi:MAG: nucleotidyltransferase [Ignavibacteriaceae bacterium]|nr:nucleotidyltransferase [Ignavibacteriaceae bacterium]